VYKFHSIEAGYQGHYVVLCLLFALLAHAVGYDSHELWWERQIELRRGDMTNLFEGILEAITASQVFYELFRGNFGLP